jgi:hypothetical protein
VHIGGIDAVVEGLAHHLKIGVVEVARRRPTQQRVDIGVDEAP